MSDLGKQVQQRNELRNREYHRQDQEYHEARRRELAAKILAGQEQLAMVERDLANVMERLTRVEEILNLKEMFAVEAVSCGVDRPGAGTCPGCCVCLGSAGV